MASLVASSKKALVLLSKKGAMVTVIGAEIFGSIDHTIYNSFDDLR